MAFTEDLTPFFAITDFGIAVLLKRGVTVLRTINAIFNSPAQEAAVYDRSFYDEKFYSARVAVNSPHLLTRTADITGLVLNDIAVVESVTYYVTFLENDGTGLSLIHLSLDTV